MAQNLLEQLVTMSREDFVDEMQKEEHIQKETIRKGVKFYTRVPIGFLKKTWALKIQNFERFEFFREN